MDTYDVATGRRGQQAFTNDAAHVARPTDVGGTSFKEEVNSDVLSGAHVTVTIPSGIKHCIIKCRNGDGSSTIKFLYVSFPGTAASDPDVAGARYVVPMGDDGVYLFNTVRPTQIELSSDVASDTGIPKIIIEGVRE